MNALHSKDVILERLKAHKVKLILLDFDGTLSPIAPTPDLAQMSEETREIVKQLSRKENVYVGIISGRQLHNVKEKVGIEGLIYAGNHGLEKEVFGKKIIFSLPNEVKQKLDRLRQKLEEVAKNYPGAWVENKEIVVVLHYRQVNDNDLAGLQENVEEIIKEYTDTFLVTKGKKVFEIKPNVGIDKGTFAKDLIEKVKETMGKTPITFYIGDDATDEDAFRQLPEAITIHVGNTNQPTYATYTLTDTTEVREFLSWLLEMIF